MQPPQDDDTTDLLDPVPAVRTGDPVGYACVSTKGQLLDRQIHALTEAGCIRIFADKKSGKNAEREELWKALDFLCEGDTLVVPSLDPLGRSVQDLIAIVSGLRKRGTTSSRPWRSSSANSSSRAPTRAWTPPAPGVFASAARRP
ncbi:recombinase family protein [Streptomyces sp. NBC_01643]|uniref:recombinase family protein n=1 Tax=Streptomyces sp. NBC_01643 TaxID=2975906 RepID=UPI00386B193C|nr:recombinase family protein [Streptomyces sp. NBC_01643]